VGALPSSLLALVFGGSAAVIWVAGIKLSRTTDALDLRLGLGQALGGLLLLAIATSLPEMAITTTAALRGNLELAIGNLVGGIAIQTLVLALLDATVTDDRPLSFLVGSLVLVLEALMVIGVVVVVLLTTQLPASASLAGISPGSVALAVVWVAGLTAINRARRGIPWRAEAPQARPGRPHRGVPHPKAPPPHRGRPTHLIALIFGLAALATLAAGVAIEESGNELATRMGLGSAVFGGTFLAAATALPEVSTGIAAVRLGDYQLAMSDIFGGNAFMPTLFLLADALAGTPALPIARPTDIWLAALGGLMTAVYAAGILMRPRRRRLRLGLDSMVVVALYALGIAGLVAVNGGG
jgi:cation:H+ antiporter